MASIVFHIDMDAFFASVEQAADPGLRGRPIAVVGSLGRSVVLTASYEARVFGVRTGMRLPEAQRLCPGIVLVQANNARYTDIATRLVRMYEEYTDCVEVFSIDEAFLDVTGTVKFWKDVETMAREIQERVRQDHALSCSVGVAPNKLLAKLASDMNKPAGCVIVADEASVPFLLEWLPVEELCGIGPRMAEHLARMGILTLGDLGRTPAELLWERFGKAGLILRRMARGEDDAPVRNHRDEEDAKSVGHSMTLPRDLTTVEEMRRVLLQLSEKVGRRMRRSGFCGCTIHVTVRHSDFQTFGKQKTYDSFVRDGLDIYARACEVLDDLPTQAPVRLLGVSVSGLTRVEELPLLAAERRRSSAVAAMDRINDRWGESTVSYGALLERVRHPGVISPAWRPDGTRRVDFGER